MPPRLDVWLHTDTAINGEQRHRVGSLPMDPDAQINAADLELPLPADIDSARQSWWASWERAKAVGLGGEWLLPEGIDTQNISALYVVGIGDETPDEHFRAQIDAGEMGMLRLGAPTNSVHGAAAAQLAKAPDEWRKVAMARLRERTNPAERQQAPAANLIAQQLTGDAAALTFFHGADSPDDTQLSRQMAQALWPALWGHWLRDVWQAGDDAHRVGLWAMTNLHPEGPLMPIRIAEQPYGLLPVTALTGWTVGTATTNEARQGEIESRTAAALASLRSSCRKLRAAKATWWARTPGA